METDGTIVLFNTIATLGLFISIKKFKSWWVDYVTGAGQQSVFTRPYFLMSHYMAGEGSVLMHAWDHCQKYRSCFRTLGLPWIESNPLRMVFKNPTFAPCFFYLRGFSEAKGHSETMK